MKLLFLELFLTSLAAGRPGIAGIASIGISRAIPMTSARFRTSSYQIANAHDTAHTHKTHVTNSIHE